ncbi:MAG: 3'-5' exonuclease [Verrucomicrobiota bacterium]
MVVTCNDSSEQAAFIAQRVLELRGEGGDLNQMAVLYRSHFHALELQLELTRRGIPFSITSGIRFFEQAHIKDVAAHLENWWPIPVTKSPSSASRSFCRHRRQGRGQALAEVLSHHSISGPPTRIPWRPRCKARAAAVPKKAAVAWAQPPPRSPSSKPRTRAGMWRSP